MNKKGNDFRDEIFKTCEKLTFTMDRMRKELKHNEDLQIARAVKALASAQGQLLKAYFSLDPSNQIPLAAGETFAHFLSKNILVKKLSLRDISDEVGIGDSVVDVVGRIGNEFIIIEAETIPTKCIEKIEKLKNAITDIVSGKITILEESSDSIFQKIKNQLATGKPIRLIFGVTRMPYQSTLKDIKKSEDSLIHPEVYYINKLPPFEISSNLLQDI